MVNSATRLPHRPHLRRPLLPIALAALLAACAATPGEDAMPARSDSYADLVTLFEDWRAFEQPPLRDGAPDYTAERMAQAHAELATYRARLEAIDPAGWPVEQQVDWHLVRAEMNGLRLQHAGCSSPGLGTRPSTRRSGPTRATCPAHEGPTHHALHRALDLRLPARQGERGEERLVARPVV